MGRKSGAELALAFAAIPAGVTTLYLSVNGLGNKTGAELALVFAAIPPGVTTLDLYWNNLGNRTGAELALAFAAIPPGVTTLDLGCNHLVRKTGSELKKAFAGLPPVVSTIGLSSSELDDLLNKKSIHGFLGFFENFPNSVKSLMIDGEIYTPPSAYLFSMPESRFNMLKYEDYVIPVEDDAGMTSYQSIKPLVPIDENTLLELIEVFEKYPTPQTDLICALLLEGRIENDVAAEKMEQMDYITQRRLYALDFFQRAACNADETLANQIEMIMMHVKNTEPADSPIHEKLSKFIFTPEKKFEEGDDENKTSFIKKSDTLPSIDLNSLRALLGAKPSNPHIFFSQDKAVPDSTNEPNLKKP